jgi:hypothetical protein
MIYNIVIYPESSRWPSVENVKKGLQGDHIDHISDVAEVTIMVELIRGACNFSKISWLSPRVFKMACNF